MTTFSDEQALERKQQKAERDRQRTQGFHRDNAVKAMYSTLDGRAYLRWLLELTGAIGHNPFRGDPHATAFQCGVLSVGQALMAHMLEVDPTRFTQLLKEPTDAPRGTETTDTPDLFGVDAEPDDDRNSSVNGNADDTALYT